MLRSSLKQFDKTLFKDSPRKQGQDVQMKKLMMKTGYWNLYNNKILHFADPGQVTNPNQNFKKPLNRDILNDIINVPGISAK